MITALLIVLTVVWCLLAFALFAGADNLAARARGRAPSFDWFEHTRWSGRSTPGKEATVWAMSLMTAAAGIATAGLLVLALLVVLLRPVLPDPPGDERPPRDAPKAADPRPER